MKNKKYLFLTALSLMLIMVLAACGGNESTETEDAATDDSNTEGATEETKPKFLSLVTGGTQGTYYALGGTFADLITDETGIKTTAEVSQASAANVNALKAGDAEIAFVQTDMQNMEN